MSFTDQMPHIVTEEDLKLKWGGRSAHDYFRCRMCGYRFQLGDVYRWVYTNNLEGKYCGNPFVCQQCDGPDVIERWKRHCDEAYSDKFWWFTFNG